LRFFFVSLLNYCTYIVMGHDNGTGSFSRHFFSAKSFSWSVYVLGIVFHLMFTLNGILLLLWIALRTTDMPLVKQYWNGTLCSSCFLSLVYAAALCFFAFPYVERGVTHPEPALGCMIYFNSSRKQQGCTVDCLNAL
jgi:hypothetical protein